ncbi:pyoverdine biosynthesis protein PvcB [Legionella lansingensis]|uniref:Pyoverdine biosynthesis protein PvcB n=1 Tax=Legionella lansingensis TaxID=45067 RepID=A0A0W0VPG8_9GAMM|nr:TauD/TfdA family dioxygenase [Legionella lansingensis]KTD21955.1 pyoverdine biosynthesis protein PvcB [Legionella lansingensis]SNV46100.1 pyoverdine biosynthesis protein PvcB [Legionella lansingensis]
MAKLTHFAPYVVHTADHFDLTHWQLKIILELTAKHKVVLLRGFAAMSRDDLLAYCQSQAQLLFWDFGPVMEMKVDKNSKNYLFTESDVPLHWDGAFHQEPRFLFFHCIEAPLATMGGETLFVNTEMVWEKASDQQQKKWLNYRLQFTTEKLAHYGGNIQRDLVTKHPQTGRTILRFAEPVGEDYLNPVSVRVLNKEPRESLDILAELSQCMRNENNCYLHQWQQGDYLFADNFSLLHGRNAFKQQSPRHLRRIQIL